MGLADGQCEKSQGMTDGWGERGGVQIPYAGILRLKFILHVWKVS